MRLFYWHDVDPKTGATRILIEDWFLGQSAEFQIGVLAKYAKEIGARYNEAWRITAKALLEECHQYFIDPRVVDHYKVADRVRTVLDGDGDFKAMLIGCHAAFQQYGNHGMVNKIQRMLDRHGCKLIS